MIHVFHYSVEWDLLFSILCQLPNPYNKNGCVNKQHAILTRQSKHIILTTNTLIPQTCQTLQDTDGFFWGGEERGEGVVSLQTF